MRRDRQKWDLGKRERQRLGKEVRISPTLQVHGRWKGQVDPRDLCKTELDAPSYWPRDLERT